LRLGEKKSSRLVRWLSIAVFLVIGSVLLFLFHQSSSPESSVLEEPKKVILPEKRSIGDFDVGEKVGEATREAQKKTVGGALSVSAQVKPLPSNDQKNKQVAEALKMPLVGEVKMYDMQENEIASVRSLVLSGGFVALPARACLGAVDWQFFPYGDQKARPVVDGLWSEGDEVGLWRIAGNAQESIMLFPWDSSMPLSWLSLQSSRVIPEANVRVETSQGDIVYLTIPEEVSEPGIFLQNGNAVGWTFGEWLHGGYLWNRSVPSANELHSDVSLFYSATFGGGQEEQFAKAILMNEETPAVERLQAFLQGIQLPVKLRREDTPERLYVENVLGDIRYLAQLLRHHGEAGKLTALVGVEIFSAAPDMELLKITVAAVAESGGYEKAVRFVENVRGYFTTEQDDTEVSSMHLFLYKAWIGHLLNEREGDEGWSVRGSSMDIFPEDPELHLFGVELALLEGDWQSAEDLLYQREYPESLRQRKDVLAVRISELKREEGAIVVRFHPGSSRIPVVANVNGRQDVDFLVDTGATFVTVPTSLLDAFGIEIQNNTPRRMVATAGGLKEAWEVNLSSIELGGWVVYNLKALVMDIPHYSQTGLLGLNFLEKFRMNLNTEKGILLLEPL
jgi:clan AA aspartic protease (TIGR02281 family)